LTKKQEEVYYAFNHPIRREIVTLLGSKGKVRATDLELILNIGSGKLYYHLKNLGNLIEQDEEKKYKLSLEGNEAYQILISGETTKVTLGANESSAFSQFLKFAKPVFLPSWLLSYIYENAWRHLPEIIILLSVGGWLCFVSGLQPIILFYVKANQPVYLTMTQFFMSWIIVYSLAEIMCFILFQRKGGSISLLIGSALSLFPMMFYPILWIINTNLNLALETIFEGWLLRGLLLFFQGWAFSILAVAVSQAKNLSIDRASSVSFTVAYLSIATYLLAKGF
jgi:hypothetical protein